MSVATKEARTPYEQHHGYVLGVLAGRCPWVPRSDREALYHEAYAAMLELERAGRLDPAEMHPRQLRVYLAKAAVRNALDERKRAETRLTVPLGPAAENRADPARPVDERVAGALDAQPITELLAELAPRQRAVLAAAFCARARAGRDPEPPRDLRARVSEGPRARGPPAGRPVRARA